MVWKSNQLEGTEDVTVEVNAQTSESRLVVNVLLLKGLFEQMRTCLTASDWSFRWSFGRRTAKLTDSSRKGRKAKRDEKDEKKERKKKKKKKKKQKSGQKWIESGGSWLK